MKLKCLILLLLIGVFIYGCAGKEVAKCTSPEDNPEHHWLTGMKAVEENKPDLALEKFQRALYCDEEFSKAYSGLAIAKAEKAKLIKDKEFRKVEQERIKNDLAISRKKAKTPEDEFNYYVAKIRVCTALKTCSIDEIEKAYFDAIDLKLNEEKLTYYQAKQAADYFTGVAYLEAFYFEKAKDRFRAVLNSKKASKWHEKADRAWKKADKIVRAMAGATVGDVGKKISLQDSITRADLAALLVDELNIEKVFAGKIPVKSQIEKMKPEFTPADTLNNPFKQEILTVLKWKIRGLEPIYDEAVKAYLFKPDQVVKRAEMALILEDVLMKITGDEKIATAFLGHEKSPFPDVRPTSPVYNAVMNMTTRGIMEAEEISGEFKPDAPVTGSDAILAIRMIKQKLNY